MKQAILFLFIILLLPYDFYGGLSFASAQGLGQKLSGRILLNAEGNGEAWYIYPVNKQRYYLGRPDDAFNIMRGLGLGINEADFQKIAAGAAESADLNLARNLAGRIILQVEKNGEAWYVNPVDLKKYYLGRPVDAFRIMRELSLGITRENLAKIHKPGASESISRYSKYEHKTIAAAGNSFKVDIVEINLDNPNLKIITAAASPRPESADKSKLCGAKPVAHYVLENSGFAGINGSYFCSDSGCEALNYYFYPIYDTENKIMINEDQLKYWTTGPIFAFDAANKFYYFKDSREFKATVDFTAPDGPEIINGDARIKMQAAIGNKPRLIQDKMNYLIDWELDDKQQYAKSTKNAVAYKAEAGSKGKIYLVSAQNATVPDLADILKTMQVDYALNLDGGYSTALFYNDEYMAGPGRDVPNAIVFSE